MKKTIDSEQTLDSSPNATFVAAVTCSDIVSNPGAKVHFARRSQSVSLCGREWNTFVPMRGLNTVYRCDQCVRAYRRIAAATNALVTGEQK